MNPAALKAAMAGEVDNFLAAVTPGGIEAQEKAGQTMFVANSTLPKEGCNRPAWEKLGFVFGTDVDDLFVAVTMPPGWRKRATEHSMHSDLLDEKGRIRAGIFYKAAFYDRRAHIHMTRRYNVDCYRPVDERGNDADQNKNTHYAVAVTCAGEELHRVGLFKLRDYKECDRLEELACAWVDKNAPLWNDPTAYWD